MRYPSISGKYIQAVALVCLISIHSVITAAPGSQLGADATPANGHALGRRSITDAQPAHNDASNAALTANPRHITANARFGAEAGRVPGTLAARTVTDDDADIEALLQKRPHHTAADHALFGAAEGKGRLPAEKDVLPTVPNLPTAPRLASHITHCASM